jgi:hypothetical protein
VVVHNIVMENTATGTQFLMLTRNYQEWTMFMQVNFEATGLWYIGELEEGEEINYCHDRLALTAILHSVPPTCCREFGRGHPWK